MRRAEGKLKELRELLGELCAPEARIGCAAGEELLQLDGEGMPCPETAFAGALFGDYRIYAYVPEPLTGQMTGDLIASLDDMAQILGYRVPLRSRDALRGRFCAYLLKGEGILALGRTPKETATAVRMVKKALRVEIAGRRLGGTRHLSPVLCALEHLVYRKKYSRNEVQADS